MTSILADNELNDESIHPSLNVLAYECIIIHYIFECIDLESNARATGRIRLKDVTKPTKAQCISSLVDPCPRGLTKCQMNAVLGST